MVLAAYQSCEAFDLTIDLGSPTTLCMEQLKALVPSPALVTCFTCTADSTIDCQEIEYLSGITQGCTIDWHQLADTLTLLKLKRKFKTVSISITPEGEGAHVALSLETVWTFGKVSFKGLLLGKDRYKQFYATESGEPFNIERHKQLLQGITESFEQEGYFNGTVADYLEYDRSSKTVDVHIVLDRKEQFKVNDIELQLIVPAYADQQGCGGLKRTLRSVLTKHTRYKKYTKELIDTTGAVLRRHLAQKGFLDATITLRESISYEQSAIKLHFTITLHERREIEFFGNHFFSSRELFHMIASFGRSAWLVPPEVLAQEFEAAYRTRGFWHITIEPVLEKDRLIFLIKEGKRARLKAVRIEGVTLDTPEHMGKKWFTRLIKQPYIDQGALQEQISRLLAWYQRQGYWDAHVLRQEFSSAGKPDTYRLILTIDEGEQRMLASVAIPGYEHFAQCTPFKQCIFSLPIPFDMALLHEQRAALLEYFHLQGFLQAHANPELTYDGNNVYVAWHIDNIEHATTFGKTIVVGKTRTHFKHIARELRYEQGQIWDQSLLEDSLASLRRLNVFESIYVAPVTDPEDEFERNVLLKLVEYDRFEVRFRAGFQQVSKNYTFRSGSTYKVGGSLLWRNPTRAGDSLRFDGDVTKYYRNVSLRYYRPWLGNSPYRTQSKLYTNRYIQPVSKGCKEPLYEVFQQGFLVGLSRAFSRIDTGGNIGIELLETANLSPDMARAINFTRSLRDRNIPHVFFEGSVLINFLDDQINPMRGSLTAIQTKGMFPWKNNAVAFFKVLFEQSCFYDPYDKVVLGMKIRFGHIFNGRFSSMMPPERFYLGGEHSLRSYEADLAPPLGSFVNEDGDRVFVPQGGKSMFNASFEARFPLYGHLGGVLFQDIGALAQNELAELSGGKLLSATGFGLRYFTPIGPVRFDLGFKWKRRDPHESRVAWFLTIGESF